MFGRSKRLQSRTEAASDPVQDVLTFVRRRVRQGVADTEVVDQLRAAFPNSEEAFRRADQQLSEARGAAAYPVRRWRGVLQAAASGTPPPSWTPAELDADEEQRQLTLMTPAAAVERLAAAQPALLGFMERWDANQPLHEFEGWRVPKSTYSPEVQRALQSELLTLVGPEADHPDALVRSGAAVQVVMVHLLARGGMSNPESFFD
jgi:hypothetical protein